MSPFSSFESLLEVDKLSKQVDFTKAELQIQQGNLTQRQGDGVIQSHEVTRWPTAEPVKCRVTTV